MMKAALRLFNAVPVNKGTKLEGFDNNNPKIVSKSKIDTPEEFEKTDFAKRILSETVRRGFILQPEVLYHYRNDIKSLVDTIENVLGLTPEQMNATLHSSWERVENAPLIELYLEQVLHYITTYGYKQLGVYSKDTVYVPTKDSDIPLQQGSVGLRVIKGCTNDELRDKVIELSSTGIALGKETLDDMIELLSAIGISKAEFEKIKNKELKSRVAKEFGFVSKNVPEFLRYIIYELTGDSLLIKSKHKLSAIRQSKVEQKASMFITMAFKYYEQQYGAIELAKRFKRYRSFFLALKQPGETARIINKAKKLSKKYNVPYQPSLIESLTKKLRNDEKIDSEQLATELSTLNIFQKLRLSKALMYHTQGPESIVYKVRNGKSYATTHKKILNLRKELKVQKQVDESIINELTPMVDGKKFYVPKGFKLTLPTSEKQFVGNIPEGSSITVGDDMIVGVHWYNQHGVQVDLDLKMMSDDNTIGWDADRRSNTILFSGDVVDPDPKNGASELYYIKKSLDDTYLLRLNDYRNVVGNGDGIEYKLIVGKESLESLPENYMLNPDNVLMTVPVTMTERQCTVGLVKKDEDDNNVFVFSNGYDGRGASSRDTTVARIVREYNDSMNDMQPDLVSFFEDAGAEFVLETEVDEDTIRLSPESLERDTIINLMTKQ